MNFIDLGAQYRAYAEELNAAVLKVMASTQFIMGAEVDALEKNLSAYTGAKHSLACSSGTDALLIPLMALGIGAGDEVITSPFTFIASAEVIALVGAKPVFVDIDETTYNLDPAKLEAAITPRTKAIMPVSLYGQVADMDEINAIAAKYGIPVIEDACQSFGADYKGKKSCNVSTVGATSFFPSKPLGCYGDGGAVFTNDDELAAKMTSIRIHGQSVRYVHKYVGVNGRLDAMQAAILNVKMKYFPQEAAKRIEIGARYSELFAASGANVVTPVVKSDRTSMYAQYSVRVKNRDAVIAKLTAAGIPTAVHYPIPLHKQECFQYLGLGDGSFPVSELVSSEIMSLPMDPFKTEEDLQQVVAAVTEATK